MKPMHHQHNTAPLLYKQMQPFPSANGAQREQYLRHHSKVTNFYLQLG